MLASKDWLRGLDVAVTVQGTTLKPEEEEEEE